jgi:adenine deaminase
VNSGLGLEDQEERELDPILANGHLADTIVMNDVEDIGVDDVAAEGGNNTMRISQISESSTDSTQSNGGLALIKKSKKGPNNKPCRPAPPIFGIRKFR